MLTRTDSIPNPLDPHGIAVWSSQCHRALGSNAAGVRCNSPQPAPVLKECQLREAVPVFALYHFRLYRQLKDSSDGPVMPLPTPTHTHQSCKTGAFHRRQLTRFTILRSQDISSGLPSTLTLICPSRQQARLTELHAIGSGLHT